MPPPPPQRKRSFVTIDDFHENLEDDDSYRPSMSEKRPSFSSERRPSFSSSKNRSASNTSLRSLSEAEVGEKQLDEETTPRRQVFTNFIETVDDEIHSKDFPEERAALLGVFNPQGHGRFYWDMFVLLLMLWVLYVVPFELAFVQSSKFGDTMFILNILVDVGFVLDIAVNLNTGYFDERRHTWVIEREKITRRYLRSWRFIVDMVALMKWKAVLGKVIAAGSSKHLHFIRLVRLVRLVRLIRLVKAPEMMASILRRISVSFKTQLVLKYFLVLVSLLHLEACAIRITHDILRGSRDHLDVSTHLSTTHILWRTKFKDGDFNGNFALYVDSLDWAFQTLLGQSMYTNTTEGVLSLLNNFCGVMFISFLIGEVANVMCNLDPAKNEYKQTVDMLNAYMAEHKFPDEMRWQLRMYLAHSEDLFRARFHDDLVQRLSPPLQELVAHFMLGSRVMKTPFFAYARRCTLGMVVGRKVFITPPDLRTAFSGNWTGSHDSTKSTAEKPPKRPGSIAQRLLFGGNPSGPSDKVAPMVTPPSSPLAAQHTQSSTTSDTERRRSSFFGRPGSWGRRSFQKEGLPETRTNEDVMTVHEIYAIMEFWRQHKVRPAEIARCCGDGAFDVKYLDDYGGYEVNVCQSRVSQEHEPAEVQRAMEHMNHVTKLIVTQFARAMKQCLYNGGDYVSRKGVTHTNRMFIVDQGAVVTFGEDVTRTISILYYREGSCAGSGELAMLAAGHESRLAWYNARALVMTRVLILDADDFLDAISMPGFEQFFKCVKRFGRWTHFRLAVWFAIREGVLNEVIQDDYGHQQKKECACGKCEAPSSPPKMPRVVQTSFAVKQKEKQHPHAQRINEAMLAGAASNHFERLLATKLALQSQHTEHLLERTKGSLDKLLDRLENLEAKVDNNGNPLRHSSSDLRSENSFLLGSYDNEDPRFPPASVFRRQSEAPPHVHMVVPQRSASSSLLDQDLEPSTPTYDPTPQYSANSLTSASTPQDTRSVRILTASDLPESDHSSTTSSSDKPDHFSTFSSADKKKKKKPSFHDLCGHPDAVTSPPPPPPKTTAL